MTTNILIMMSLGNVLLKKLSQKRTGMVTAMWFPMDLVEEFLELTRLVPEMQICIPNRPTVQMISAVFHINPKNQYPVHLSQR